MFGLEWKYNKFRNRLDTVKRQYEVYKRVIPDSSGVKFYEETGAIEMPFTWWENLIKEKPEAKTFRNYPSHDIPLIENLFSEVSISAAKSVEDSEPNSQPEAQNHSDQPQRTNKRSRSKQSKSSQKMSKADQWDRVLDLIEDQGRFFMGGRESFYTYSSAACVKEMEEMIFLNQLCCQ
ncbi:unnamed protein product [Arabis nemorensis]|uniref:Myb/SANT-like domain-containing protein n=1 Tax=Arabis nemorensis TaxID=586526 RepID=A0A565AX53_9BRAS|nr:unnamed protein product [Arabis nemorensis]